jgi:hypothetical protein
MKRPIILANMVLILCMVGLTYKLKLDWDRWNQQHNMQQLMARVRSTAPALPAADTPAARPPLAANELSYISDNNLFHKDRNMELPKADEAAKAAVRLDNPPEIMGVVVLEGERYVQARPQKGGAEGGHSMQLGVGDKWEDIWQVETIRDDRIVLVSGEVREEVLFHDPSKRRPQKASPAKQAKAGSGVLTIGGGGGRGGTATTASRTTTASADAAATKPTAPTAASRTPDRGKLGSTRDFLSRRSGSSQLGSQNSSLRSNSMQRSSPFRSNQRRKN